MEYIDWNRFHTIIIAYKRGLLSRSRFVTEWKCEQERQMYLGDIMTDRR